jgi:predicted branched-subunit amino acid permease
VTLFFIFQIVQLFAKRNSGMVGSSAAAYIASAGILVLLPMVFTTSFICGLVYKTVLEKQSGENAMLTAGYYRGRGLDWYVLFDGSLHVG